VQNKLVILLLFWTSIVCQAEGLPPLTHKLTAIKPILPAPSLQLKDSDGDIVDIKDLKGKVIVVNFWATWCPPCRREMASLERLHLATQAKDVVILAVNIGEDLDTVFSFMGQIEPAPTFPILFDSDAVSMDKWQVKGLPTTYIIDSNGQIIYRAVGGREFDHPDIINKVLGLH